MPIKLTPRQIEQLVAEKEAELNKHALKQAYQTKLRDLIKEMNDHGLYVAYDKSDGDSRALLYEENWRVY
jgi:hypothetical protein